MAKIRPLPSQVCICWETLVLSLALTEGYAGSLHESRHGSSVQIRRRKASGDPYWAYSGELCWTGVKCEKGCR
uniref:Secreted protein n=1 Tax=Sphenodon punctatus TaxID=8508 RepID=A0A8D0H3F5_SPHPU